MRLLRLLRCGLCDDCETGPLDDWGGVTTGSPDDWETGPLDDWGVTTTPFDDDDWVPPEGGAKVGR